MEKQDVELDKIWLNFFNQYLYEHNFITEAERNKMINKISNAFNLSV